MPFVRSNDITVHYDFAGPRDAPVVVLANSLGANMHMWDDQINALARKHRVLRYDMRGHGLTDTTPGDEPAAGSIEQLGGDVIALAKALGVNRFSFMGLSIGGLIGQYVGARHRERIDRLVLCATASRMGTPEIWDARLEEIERGGVEAIVDATMGRWFTQHTHADRPDLVRGFANMVRRTPKAGYLAGARAVRDADMRHSALGIEARTLVVAGAHDPTATPQLAAELRDGIPGARLEVLHSAAHMVNAEQPVAFNEAVLRFLEAA
ncbi:MAG TPA: 3-oxoadipate enol-lactonase [Candidatus Limnocylindrales bacterium]|nr:3-oxoadipate enol-lactonase [Candidatus Limnocylindrales bacterium]